MVDKSFFFHIMHYAMWKPDLQLTEFYQIEDTVVEAFISRY